LNMTGIPLFAASRSRLGRHGEAIHGYSQQ
jgi:hypothetical protein